MGKRIARSFFEAPELLFVGYSKKQESFCAAVREAFEKRGTKVYPVNPKPAAFTFPVYAAVAEVPAKPQLAYVLTNKGHTAGLVDQLAAHGVKRIVFQSKMSVDAETLQRCAQLGMETAVACPMMALGGGFHRFHGFLAGVRG